MGVAEPVALLQQSACPPRNAAFAIFLLIDFIALNVWAIATSGFGGLLEWFASARDDMGRGIERWSDDVEQYLLQNEWPGNVRELENAIERAVVLARGSTIELEDIAMGSSGREEAGGSDDLQSYLDNMTRKKIREVLAKEDSKTDAAERLGIDRTTLHRMMKRLGLD